MALSTLVAGFYFNEYIQCYSSTGARASSKAEHRTKTELAARQAEKGRLGGTARHGRSVLQSNMGLGQRKSKGGKGGHKTKNKEYKKGHATKNR